ncbi:MAG: 30S ribosomal protein S5 [Chloroflexota bacterium]
MPVRNEPTDMDEGQEELIERVVHINRVSKVVQGGRRFGFNALVVVGDGKGRVGVGLGRAREVPQAIRKGAERARRAMVEISLMGSTVPHDVLSKYGAAKVLLKPASPGTGVIAGSGVRAVVMAAGIKDILSKSLTSDNVFNVVMATFQGLQQMTSIEAQARRRNKDVADLLPPWRAKANGN